MPPMKRPAKEQISPPSRSRVRSRKHQLEITTEQSTQVSTHVSADLPHTPSASPVEDDDERLCPQPNDEERNEPSHSSNFQPAEEQITDSQLRDDAEKPLGSIRDMVNLFQQLSHQLTTIFKGVPDEGNQPLCLATCDELFQALRQKIPEALGHFHAATCQLSFASLSHYLSDLGDTDDDTRSRIFTCLSDIKLFTRKLREGELNNIPNPLSDNCFDCNRIFKVLLVDYSTCPSKSLYEADLEPLEKEKAEGHLWYFCLKRLVDGNICPFFAEEEKSMEKHQAKYHWFYKKFDIQVEGHIKYRLKKDISTELKKIALGARVGKNSRLTRWRQILKRARTTEANLLMRGYIMLPTRGHEAASDIVSHLENVPEGYLEFEDPPWNFIPKY